MSIKVNIHPFLHHLTNDQDAAEVDGTTVGECLNHLVKQFPGIETMLFAKNGKLHSYVGIYVNAEDIYPEELTKPVKDRDKLDIIYLIGGG